MLTRLFLTRPPTRMAEGPQAGDNSAGTASIGFAKRVEDLVKIS